MRRYLWIAFLIIDLLLIGVFLSGYVARWVDPRILWWPQLFAIILPFSSFIVLMAAIVLWIRKKWLLLGIHVVCMVLAFFRFFSFSSPPDVPLDDASTLRISSYNLGQLETLTQSELASKLSEVLRLIYPDIFGMQEFLIRYRGNPLQFRNLPEVADMLDSLGFQIIASTRHTVSNSFQPVLIRRDKLTMYVKERIPVADGAGMGVIRTQIAWQGRDAAIYNVHLQTFGERKPWTEKSLNPFNPAFWRFFLIQYRDAFLYRAWQADRIHELIENETLPVIVLGDFNSTPHNWAFNRIATNLRDVFEETGLKRKASYHSRFPIARIDHVLVTEEWQVHRADIMPFSYSDHRPLLVVLGWK